MTLNITLAIIPVLCMNCTINHNAFPSELNETLPSIDELSTFLEGLPAILAALNTPAAPLVPTLPAYPATPEELLLAELGQPPVQRQLPLKVQTMPPATAVFTIPLSFRQDTTTTHGIMSTITSMIAGMMPFNRHHTEPTPSPAPDDVPLTHKHQDQKKAAHLDHEHVNEPAQSLPDGVVSGGFYYEGQKANGEYFNEETPAAEALEVHQSHKEVSAPGKLYDDNSEHPYYVVDKPEEGPAPPPLQYFSSGLRNEATASSHAAWNIYYAKLKEYNDYYRYYYQRSGRSTKQRRNQGSYESVELRNQVTVPGKSSSTKSDR